MINNTNPDWREMPRAHFGTTNQGTVTLVVYRKLVKIQEYELAAKVQAEIEELKLREEREK